MLQQVIYHSSVTIEAASLQKVKVQSCLDNKSVGYPLLTCQMQPLSYSCTAFVLQTP